MPAKSPLPPKTENRGGRSKIFVSRPAAGAKLTNFRWIRAEMEVAYRKNRANVVFFALQSRKIGSGSGRRRLRTRRLAATLSEPTLTGARGTENQKYHTTFGGTIPLSQTTEKVVNTSQIPVKEEHCKGPRAPENKNRPFSDRYIAVTCAAGEILEAGGPK